MTCYFFFSFDLFYFLLKVTLIFLSSLLPDVAPVEPEQPPVDEEFGGFPIGGQDSQPGTD